MLGFERKEPFVVKGKYAKRLREQLYRITTGNYNRNDILSAAAKHEKSNIKIVMKNDVKSTYNDFSYEDLLAEQINDATSKYIVFVNPTIKFDYKTTGTCAQVIHFERDDDKRIHNISFEGGCNGNLKAVSKLCEGMTAEEISAKLLGNLCRDKGTSCADQLAKAVMSVY